MIAPSGESPRGNPFFQTHVPANVSYAYIVIQSKKHAPVTKQHALVPPINSSPHDSPSLIIDDSCFLVKDFSYTLLVCGREFCSLPNMNKLCQSEGF